MSLTKNKKLQLFTACHISGGLDIELNRTISFLRWQLSAAANHVSAATPWPQNVVGEAVQAQHKDFNRQWRSMPRATQSANLEHWVAHCCSRSFPTRPCSREATKRGPIAGRQMSYIETGCPYLVVDSVAPASRDMDVSQLTTKGSWPLG